MTGGGQGPAIPPADVVPVSGEPQGPSTGDVGPINQVLGLVGGFFDILNRISTSPAYLGQYRDPTTGTVYRPSSEPGTRGVSDFFPQLTMLEMASGPAGGLAMWQRSQDTLKVWQDKGLNPLQQMMQAYAAPSANEAMWAAQPAEIRGGQRAFEEVLKVPGSVVAAAGEATLGGEWQGALGALKDAALHASIGGLPGIVESQADIQRFAKHVVLGRVAQDAIAAQPGLPARLGMAIRDAYFEGATDPSKGSTVAAITGSLLDPTWLVMPWGRMGRLADAGATAIAKSPVVSPIIGKAAQVAKPIGEWAGSSWWALTKTSQAHIVGESVHDLTARVMQLNGEGLGMGLEAGPAIRAVRSVLTSGLDTMPNMKTYLMDNPRGKDLLLAEAKLKQFNDPKFSVPKWIEERNLAIPQTKGKEVRLGLIDRITAQAEREGWTGSQFADNLKNVTESLTLRQLNPKAANRGIWSQAYDAIHGVNQTLSSYWRPLVLLTRPVYYINNMSVAMMQNTQQFGRWWDRMDNSFLLAQAEGELPVTTAGRGFPGLAPDAEAPLTYSQHFLKSGFSSKGLEEISGTNVPELLQKLPVLGGWLNRGSELAQNWERRSHEITFLNAYHQFLPKDIAQFVQGTGSAALAQELDGVVGVQQALARLNLPQTGYHGVEAWVDYSRLPQNIAEMVKDAVNKAAKGGKIVDGETINTAFNQARMELTELHTKRMGSAKLMKPYSGMDEDLTQFTRRLSVDATPVQQQLADESTQIGAEAARRLNTAHMEDNLITNMGVVDSLGDEATTEYLTRFHKTYSDVLQRVEGRNREMRQIVNQLGWDTNEAWRKTRVVGKTGRINPDTQERLNGLWEAYWASYKNLNQATLNAQESVMNIFTYANYKRASGQPLSEATIAGYFREATAELRDPKLFNPANITLGKPAFVAQVKVRPLTAEALTWRKVQLERAKRSALVGQGLPQDSLQSVLNDLGAPVSFNPYLPVDTVAEESARQLREVHRLDDTLLRFNDKLNMQQGLPQNEAALLSEKFGVDINQFVSDLRAVGAKSSDKAILESKKLNFDYAGGQRNVDQFTRLFFPFHFWPTRYMAWQVQWAAKNPAQASAGLRVLKSWYDGNEDQPWFDKFSVHLANLDYGTPTETQVRFSPINLLFPMGYAAMDVAHSLNPEESSNVGDLAEVLTNSLGGQFYPWVAMPASTLGLNPDGRAPKSIEDMLKGIVPPIDLLRKGAAVVAPGAVGLITRAESDKVIRNLTDDVNLGTLDRGQAVIAATSIAQGKPNALALEYLKQESPARFAGTLFRGLIGGGSTTTLGERATSQAYEALNASRTAGERATVYGAAPGLGIGIAGKTGPARDLSILYANSPESPVLRSAYYAAHRDELKKLRDQVDVEQAAKGVPDWKFRAATPESYERFRAAGGVNLAPSLVDYWYKGQGIPPTQEKELQALYAKEGMGALTYRDWKDRILMDAYLQWVSEKRTDILQGILKGVDLTNTR